MVSVERAPQPQRSLGKFEKKVTYSTILLPVQLRPQTLDQKLCYASRDVVSTDIQEQRVESCAKILTIFDVFLKF